MIFLRAGAYALISAVAMGQLVGLSEGGPDDKGPILYLPGDQRTKNVGGSDGAGLCVFTSIGHAARFQNVDQLKDFQAWMRSHPGGGYPRKVDDMIDRLCAQRGLTRPSYLQVESKDASILKMAIQTGRMPSITYDGRDMHYRGHIEHMVSLVGMTDDYAVILDNNFVGESQFVYLTFNEFLSRWIGQGGPDRQGWAVILLDPGRAPVGGK